MLTISEDIPVLQNTKYFGPATVLDFKQDEGLVRLRIEGVEEDYESWGRSAIAYPHKYTSGESVLVAGEDTDALYVIGLLSANTSQETAGSQLSLRNGARAEVAGSLDAEKIHVYSNKGELIFEYDPEAGKSRVNVQSGDLEFVTKNGNMSFISEQNINFFSRQSIEMKSLYGISLGITNTFREVLSSIALRHRKMKLNSPELGMTAKRGEINIEETRYTGKKFSGTLKHAKLIIGRLETITNDVISKAGNVYKTVEGLTQLKTGRMRTLVKSTLHIKAKKTYLKSEEDFKVKADKIHLG